MYICSSSKGKRAQVFFDLVFNGQITREEIEKILRAHSTYEDKDGLRYFKFRDFIVDINKILNPPVLPTRGPDIEIIGTIAHKHTHSDKAKYKAAVVFFKLQFRVPFSSSFAITGMFYLTMNICRLTPIHTWQISPVNM